MSLTNYLQVITFFSINIKKEINLAKTYINERKCNNWNNKSILKLIYLYKSVLNTLCKSFLMNSISRWGSSRAIEMHDIRYWRQNNENKDSCKVKKLILIS